MDDYLQLAFILVGLVAVAVIAFIAARLSRPRRRRPPRQ